jgi:hypothetical protein
MPNQVQSGEAGKNPPGSTIEAAPLGNFLGSGWTTTPENRQNHALGDGKRLARERLPLASVENGDDIGDGAPDDQLSFDPPRDSASAQQRRKQGAQLVNQQRLESRLVDLRSLGRFSVGSSSCGRHSDTLAPRRSLGHHP